MLLLLFSATADWVSGSLCTLTLLLHVQGCFFPPHVQYQGEKNLLNE